MTHAFTQKCSVDLFNAIPHLPLFFHVIFNLLPCCIIVLLLPQSNMYYYHLISHLVKLYKLSRSKTCLSLFHFLIMSSLLVMVSSTGFVFIFPCLFLCMPSPSLAPPHCSCPHHLWPWPWGLPCPCLWLPLLLVACALRPFLLPLNTTPTMGGVNWWVLCIPPTKTCIHTS